MRTRAHVAREAVSYDSVTIRRVTPGDHQAVERLAELEGRPAIRADALLAEAGGRVLAVHSLHDGRTLAGPVRRAAARLAAATRH